MIIRIRNWRIFVGKPRPEPEPRHNLSAFDFSMTEEMWRDSGNHLGWMRAQLSSDYGKEFIGVLHNSAPQRHPSNVAPTDTQAAIELGRVKGYTEAVDLIHRLVVPLVKPEELEADYGARKILEELNYPQPKG